MGKETKIGCGIWAGARALEEEKNLAKSNRSELIETAAVLLKAHMRIHVPMMHWVFE